MLRVEGIEVPGLGRGNGVGRVDGEGGLEGLIEAYERGMGELRRVVGASGGRGW